MNSKTLAKKISMALVAWLSKSKDMDVDATLLEDLGDNEDGVLLTIENDEYKIVVSKL